MVINRAIAEKHINAITNEAAHTGLFKMNGNDGNGYYKVFSDGFDVLYLFVANGIKAATTNIYEADLIFIDWMEAQGYTVAR